MYVFDRDGHVAGLLRVERDSPRDEWTVVELDAVGDLDAGDVRFRLVQHLLRDGGKRGAVAVPRRVRRRRRQRRAVHAGGVHPVRRRALLFREPERPAPAPLPDDEARGRAASGPAAAIDAVPLVAPVRVGDARRPVQRLEAVRIHDWERQGRDWRVPRSSLAPILRFADVDAFVQEAPRAAARTGRSSTRSSQVGVAKEDQPHYLKVMARPEASTSGRSSATRWA